jgi:mono/diheme cytochrome c family protein
MRRSCEIQGSEVFGVSARLTLILIVGLPLLAAGCGRPEAEFVYNARTDNLMREAQEGMAVERDGKPVRLGGLKQAIEDNFGTPQHLVAWLRLPVDYGGLEGTKTDEEGGSLVGKQKPGYRLKEGRRLFMTHCLHCHGVSGDGDGPTAKYLNPRPRDYRLGLFKFTSTGQADKALRGDLARIVKQGIPGTYMPSFMLLEKEELKAIVEYVRWLAMRGELENRLDAELTGDYSQDAFKQRKDDGEDPAEIKQQLADYLADEFPENVDTAATALAEVWRVVEEENRVVIPKKKRNDNDAASRARGRALFLSDKTKCIACHGITGRGNGPRTEDFEKKPGTDEEYSKPGLFDNWGHPIKPRNLTTGIYRGGRRPIDIYRRIYAGIKGTPMAAFGGNVLNDDEIWDLVNYVMSIPFQKQGVTSQDAATEVAAGTGGKKR